MSKHELIEAYITGRIGRRDFARRLTALGVSSAAAAAYVHSLSPAAAASGLTRNGNGFVVRMQPADPYGPLPIEELLEILRVILAVIERLIALLDRLLPLFGSGAVRASRQIAEELSESDRDALTTLRDQLELQLEALQTAIADFGGDPTAVATSAEISEEDSDAALTALAALVNGMVGVYAGVIPAIPGTDEQAVALRQTVTGIALVQARQASFLNRLIGESPFPDTFEPAGTEDALLTALEDAGE